MDDKELSKINEEYASNRLFMKMTLKSIKVLEEDIVVSNEEIEELIEFFQKMEHYTICARLKKLMK